MNPIRNCDNTNQLILIVLEKSFDNTVQDLDEDFIKYSRLFLEKYLGDFRLNRLSFYIINEISKSQQ